MLANKWRGVLVRFVKEELERLDAYCKENHVKRTDVIRSATRLYIANRDLVNGVFRVTDANPDITPVMDNIGIVVQKIEAVEKKLDLLSVENDSENSKINERLAEAVLMVKRRAKNDAITLDQLRERLTSIDFSFAPFLYATDSSGICILDEVLLKLEENGELRRQYGGIIKFRR
jgi:hypothetical protein